MGNMGLRPVIDPLALHEVSKTLEHLDPLFRLFIKMSSQLTISNLLGHPVLLGGSLGILAAGSIGLCAPASELQGGDSRIVMAIVGAVFLVPGFIVTVYGARLALRNVRQLPRLRAVWMAFALFFTFAVAIGALTQWIAARQFWREGRSVNGTVLEVHPEDHNTLIVAYTIEGVDYRCRSSGPRAARSYKPGDPFQVYYYVSAPSEGFGVEPRWQPGAFVIAWLLGAGIGPIYLIGVGGTLVLRTRPIATRIRQGLNQD